MAPNSNFETHLWKILFCRYSWPVGVGICTQYFPFRFMVLVMLLLSRAIVQRPGSTRVLHLSCLFPFGISIRRDGLCKASPLKLLLRREVERTHFLFCLRDLPCLFIYIFIFSMWLLLLALTFFRCFFFIIVHLFVLAIILSLSSSFSFSITFPFHHVIPLHTLLRFL